MGSPCPATASDGSSAIVSSSASEIVAERVGPALRPEADGRRDAVEEMIGGDEGPVAVEHQLAVRMPWRGDGLPAVHEVAGLEQLGVGLEADELPVHGPLLDQLGGHPVGDTVPAEPVDEHVGPVVSAPDERTLLVVEPPLSHRRAGELGHVAGGADMIRVEVGDEDPGDPAGKPVELRGPPVPRVGEPEAGVHERPAVLAREQIGVDVSRPRRQRERDAHDAAGELVHASTLRGAPQTHERR